jgi:hypothetical protein
MNWWDVGDVVHSDLLTVLRMTQPLNVDIARTQGDMSSSHKSNQMRIICTCLRWQGSPDYSRGLFFSVNLNFASFVTIFLSQIFLYQKVNNLKGTQ